MAIPYDLSQEGAFIYKIPEVAGTPTGDNDTWVPGFNGCILGGWAAYEVVPTTNTATVGIEIGTVDAISWTFTSADTTKRAKAGTLVATDTNRYFDTDDILTLDIVSANKSETTLNVWLLIKSR